MVTTQGQENNDKEASSSQGGNSVEQLAALVQNIIEQSMRKDNQPVAPPSAPPLRQDTSDDSAGERFRKLQPPTFDGGVDPIQAEQWIRTTECMLAYAKVRDGDKVLCASFMLRHHAEYWWDTISSIHDITTMTQERFRKLFYGKYFTDTMKANRRAEFANLKQGGMSVTEYIRKFDELSRYAPHMVATNELKVDQFIQGLKKTIVRDLKACGIKSVSFAQITDRAFEAEQAKKDILDGERAIRERQARQAHQNFRPGIKKVEEDRLRYNILRMQKER